MKKVVLSVVIVLFLIPNISLAAEASSWAQASADGTTAQASAEAAVDGIGAEANSAAEASSASAEAETVVEEDGTNEIIEQPVHRTIDRKPVLIVAAATPSSVANSETQSSFVTPTADSAETKYITLEGKTDTVVKQNTRILNLFIGTLAATGLILALMITMLILQRRSLYRLGEKQNMSYN